MARDWNNREIQGERPDQANDSSEFLNATSVCLERHFTVSEVANMWQLSLDAVRRLFCNEPGVLVIANTKARGSKRRYTTLRIPHSVLERVHARYSLYNRYV